MGHYSIEYQNVAYVIDLISEITNLTIVELPNPTKSFKASAKS